MLRSVLAVVLLAFMSVAAFAQSISETEKTEFQRIITAQISAFRADDGPTAYSFAAPVVRNIFPTPEIFMSMVKRGYPQVYRPQAFNFTEAVIDPLGRPAQKMRVVGPDGKTYEALYSMEKQPDGTWRISGCTLLEIPGPRRLISRWPQLLRHAIVRHVARFTESFTPKTLGPNLGRRNCPGHRRQSLGYGPRTHLQMRLCQALAWRGDEFGEFPTPH